MADRVCGCDMNNNNHLYLQPGPLAVVFAYLEIRSHFCGVTYFTSHYHPGHFRRCKNKKNIFNRRWSKFILFVLSAGNHHILLSVPLSCGPKGISVAVVDAEWLLFLKSLNMHVAFFFNFPFCYSSSNICEENFSVVKFMMAFSHEPQLARLILS